MFQRENKKERKLKRKKLEQEVKYITDLWNLPIMNGEMK